MLGRTCRFRADQREIERYGNSAGDVVLKGEQLSGIVVEAIGPDIRICFGVDQLDIDACAIALAADAASQNIADIQIAADLSCIDPLILIGKGRVA